MSAMVLPVLPLTWQWLGVDKVPANYTRGATHPDGARWATSTNRTPSGEWAVLVPGQGGGRPLYGPTWRSLAEAVNAAWIEPT